MEFIVSSGQLNQQLQIASKVLKAKPTLPILEYFLFTIKDNHLKITATDLETSFRTELDVDNANEEGAFAIESKHLVDFLKGLPEQPLFFKTISNEEGTGLSVQVRNSKGEYMLMGEQADDYPKIPNIEDIDAQVFKLKAEVLAKGIQSTLFATANDEYRPAMNGIFFEILEDQLNMVASDAHKLVKYSYLNIDNKLMSSFILPKKTASLLRSIIPMTDDEVEVHFNEKNIFFHFDTIEVVAQLVEGKFPNYSAVIPVENNKKMTAVRTDFADVLKRVSIFTNSSTNQIKLAIASSKMVIEGQDIDYSIAGKETMNVQYEGDPIEIGFKSTFLLEIINNLTTQEILMELSEPSRACVVYPVDNDNENETILMLLMPMMVN